MTKWQKYKWFLYLYFCYDLPEKIRNIRRRFWNAGIKLWWYRLFIRKGEFHKSLDLDIDAMIVMDDEKLQKYCDDVVRRRLISHERDLAEQDASLKN